MSKSNSHKKTIFQDNFIKNWCKSSHNHPSGWAWWKRKNKKDFRHKMKKEVKENESTCI